MEDSKERGSKVDNWFDVEFWFDLVKGAIGTDGDMAEKLMALFGSLREMIESNKSGRKAASKAIGNAIRACGRYTESQCIAERAQEWEAQRRKKRGQLR